MQSMAPDAWRTRTTPVKWPELEVDGLRLRPATPADAEDWFTIRAQAGPWQPPLADIATARTQLLAMEAEPPFTPGWRQFILEEGASTVGDIGLNWPAEDDIAEIGFELAASARGRGLARRALTMLTEWLFHATALQGVVGITHQDNHPARKTLAAAGFAASADPHLLTRFAVQPQERLHLRRRDA